MIIVRLSLSLLILSFTSLFLFSNIEQLGEGSGYLSLGVIFTLGALLLVTSGRWHVVTRLKMSHIWLLLFLVYFIVNLLFDTNDLGPVKAATVGTTGGVIFALVLGFMLSFVFSEIYLGMKKLRLIGYVAFLIVLYLGWNVILATQAYQAHLSELRNDLFLIENQEGSYQRPGNFMFVQCMIGSALVVLLYVFRETISKLIFAIALMLHAATASIYMLLAQLIGSNSGLASIAGFFVMMLTFFYVARLPMLKQGLLSIGIKALVLGWIGRRITIGLCISASFLVVGWFYLLTYTEIDLAMLRITGYGSGEVSSVNSRAEIFENNFIEHFSYNPIFGNTQVDTLTTGTGTYAHSLLSILTHLGLVGFVIFVCFIFQVYREITRYNHAVDSLHTDRVYALFRLFALGIVLFFSLLTAFYTWLPLWFAIGFFGIGMSRGNHPHTVLDLPLKNLPPRVTWN